MHVTPSLLQAIHEPFALEARQVEFYRKNGFIKIPNVFDGNTIGAMEALITAEVLRLNKEQRPLEERDTYGKAFLQVMNIWRQNEAIKQLVFGQRLARMAAELMEVDGVRLYHDQALYKEAGGGHTPWHADQYYWPLATDKCVTAWVPLQPVPLEMGPLAFSAASDQLTEGRNLPISDDSQQLLEQTLTKKGFSQVEEPFGLGEVSFHKGWLYHRAGSNKTDSMRKVMTIIYMDADMRLKYPENPNQQADWDAWCTGAEVGEVIDTALNPVIWRVNR
jgi:ectoine hydroxylase-related dioxygenase (phytanoyl-CoA dioxygenase family)